MKKIVIKENDANQRIDKYLKKLLCNAPSNFIYKMFRKKDIKINGKKVNEKYILQKDDILEMYVNTIYFGDGYYGIKQACNGYLDKEPQNMTLYEATMMAGIPNAPSVYAPTVNPDLTKSRQQKVINSMVEYGYLTQEEAEKIHE